MNSLAQPSPRGDGDETTPLYEQKPPRAHRKRLNGVPIFLCIVVPCLLFNVVAAAIAFNIHYEHRWIMYLIVGSALLATLLVGGFAFRAGGKRKVSRESWMSALAIIMLVAFVLACVCGSILYNNYMLKYYEYHNLNHYADINPSHSRGQHVMDAGYIVFANGTFVDVPRSMGFKNVDLYCVAPIAFGNSPLVTYDFWAVGKDCCDGLEATFHCDATKDTTARSGLRLLSDADRAYYRLAVQQAEETYKIKAEYPLFFEWTSDAEDKLDGWKHDARRDYLVWSGCVCALVFFFVVSTAVCFSKQL